MRQKCGIDVAGLRLVSIDAETNGLRGEAFAVAAVATDEAGVIVDTLVARCPIVGEVDPWVEANVLPAMRGVPPTHDNYAGLLDALRGFLARHAAARVVTHVAWPVEAKLLLDAYPSGGYPYPLIDVAAALFAHGHNPTPVDDFLTEHGQLVTGMGSPHHPLYDAVAAERCLRILLATTVNDESNSTD